MRLTWADLLIDNLSEEECRPWIEPWTGHLRGSFAPVFLNKFGCWFLRRPEGQVEMLDVFTGGIERQANTHAEFVAQVNEPWWQETYLLSELVHELHEAGKVPGPGQCYALAPHPAVGGPHPLRGEKVDPRFVMVMDVALWQSLCAQAVFRRQS